MNDDNTDTLRDTLRDQVRATEPPFDTTTRTWHQTGQRLVRRRRQRLIGGAVSAAAAVAVAVGLLATTTTGDRPDAPEQAFDIPAAAQKALDNFDPATFPAIADEDIRNNLEGVIPSNVEGRIEPTLDSVWLRPDDYQFANAWTATYQLTPEDRITVNLQRSQANNEGAARRYCRENLAADAFQPMDRCTYERLLDGTLSISTVTKVRYTPAGYTRVRTQDDPDTWWYQRQVYNRRDYGFGVAAREYVKATSLQEADQKWSVSTAQLGAAAASPVLVFVPPTAPTGCQVGFTVPTDENEPADVRCE